MGTEFSDDHRVRCSGNRSAPRLSLVSRAGQRVLCELSSTEVFNQQVERWESLHMASLIQPSCLAGPSL